jgi:hypothetical protein
MRRSAYVFAPMLAAAAIALPAGHRAAAQEPPASTQQSATTVRNGFGESFREHPWMWVLGTTFAGYIFFGPGG